MPLAPALQTLLENARAEAKRAGHAHTQLPHLALVLHRRDAEQFRAVFGEQADAWLRQLLDGLPRSSAAPVDDPATIDVLERTSAGGGSLQTVLNELHGLLGSAVDVVEAAAPGGGPTGGPEGARETAPASVSDAGEEPVPEHVQGLVELVAPRDDVVGRDSVATHILSLLGRRTPAVPCLTARPGQGRTAVLAVIAARLQDPTYAGPLAGGSVLRVRPEGILTQGRAQALRRVIDSVDRSDLLVLDDVEVLAAMGGSGADLNLLGLVRALVEDPERRVLLTMADPYPSRLSAHDKELHEELTFTALAPLDDATVKALAEQKAAELASFHGVTYPPDVVRASQAPPASEDDRGHPGLLIERLDSGGAHAALRADRTVAVADLGLGTLPPSGLDTDTLEQRLNLRIQGQGAAVRQVAERLALTRAGMDLRPERPDGVFLFVGPTGVGKTALARALCAETYGDEERLIRLDMSEYAHDWAVSRLVGPQPGYVGYTEPEGWLTTKVRAQPQTVVLLDEIEKAHPAVWNTFLQVFDAGRLTDARGQSASFSDVIVAMTSNLGADAFRAPALGFRSGGDPIVEQDDRVRDAIKTAMAPELINRLDAIIVFHPLTLGAIHEIARLEIDTALGKLSERGYDLRASDEAVALIASTGHDPAYGARHLHRNIEQLLLQPLVRYPPGRLVTVVADGRVEWHSA